MVGMMRCDWPFTVGYIIIVYISYFMTRRSFYIVSYDHIQTMASANVLGTHSLSKLKIDIHYIIQLGQWKGQWKVIK